MALIDEARAVVGTRGPRCTAGMFLAALTDQQRTEVDEALADPALPTSALIAALEARHMTQGWAKPPKTQTMLRHHRGLCSCG